jgi:hypothetical protein
MDILQTAWKVFMAFALGIGIVLMMASLIAEPRQRHDWAMFAGVSATTFGLAVIVLAINGGLDRLNDEGAYAIMGLSGLGTMLFAMSFLYDQLRTRRVHKLRQELETMNPQNHE